MGKRALAGALTVALLVPAGCGDDESGPGGEGGDAPRLVVSAAASMTDALEDCSPRFEGARVRLSFAGSDELAAQIRQGVKPDVFASANTTLPAELHADGLLAQPVEFIANELVLAVPEGSGLGALEDLAGEGVKVVIGSESVPIGSYTREVLDRLPDPLRRAIIANVRSNEPDVKGIVGKLTQRAADAGFVYRSDVEATNGALSSIVLPARLQPTVVYAAAVVEGAQQPLLAERYVRGLRRGACQRALREAGFGALR